MQDWEWEVADARRFDEFVAAYRTEDLTEDERFLLMEMLVQCVEDIAADTGNHDAAWSVIKPFVLSRPRLHEDTVSYWACLDKTDGFRVSPDMRRLWRIISS